MTAREYLRSRSWLGEKFGLKTMRLLTRELGHPERTFRSILIAGTNGKGSVSAYLDEALRAGGLKVGRYTSPHLIDIRERMTVAGRNISKATFDRLVLEVRDAAERLLLRGRIKTHPNHFEILTAVAFLHFRRSAIDIAVLEVGLGGRLDATNVSDPLVSAIVSIDFDHEEYLGRTLAAIAREKAGILRKGRIAVLGPMPEEAARSIRDAARALKSTIVWAERGVSMKSVGAGLVPALLPAREGALDIRTPVAFYPRVRPFPGAHQRINLLVAIRSLEALVKAGVEVDLQRAVLGMSHAVWPGRLEKFEGHPPFLLDGAHNPAGARALALHLKQTRTPHVLVFGAMRDKHIKEMADALFPMARLIVATRVRMSRAATTKDLAEIARPFGVRVIEQPSVRLALQSARTEARRGEAVVVAGSLYLVGAARKLLLTKPRISR